MKNSEIAEGIWVELETYEARLGKEKEKLDETKEKDVAILLELGAKLSAIGRIKLEFQKDDNLTHYFGGTGSVVTEADRKNAYTRIRDEDKLSVGLQKIKTMFETERPNLEKHRDAHLPGFIQAITRLLSKIGLTHVTGKTTTKNIAGMFPTADEKKGAESTVGQEGKNVGPSGTK